MMKSEFAREAVVPVASVAAALTVGGLFILAIGQNPFYIYGQLFNGVFGSWYGFGEVLYKATNLTFTGLAVALAFKTGLFNVGAEGQAIVGAFAVAWTGFTLPGLHPALLLPLCLLAGFAAGAGWACIPGALKVKTGAHEVITTIMMNFLAAALVNYLVTTHFHLPETVRTVEVPDAVHLPRLSAFFDAFSGSKVNMSLAVALAACVAVWYMLWKTPLGYEIRAVGLNPSASRSAGIPVERRMFLALALAGGLAGLVGSNFVLGYKYYYEDGFSGGVGFMGIAVALLGQNHPVGIVLAALLFGTLSHGGFVISGDVPKELVDILQAIVILFVIIGNTVFKDQMAGLAAKRAGMDRLDRASPTPGKLR